MLTMILGLLGVGGVGTAIAGFAFPGFGALLIGAGKGILAWLSHLSLAEIACVVLAVVALGEFVAIKAEKRHSAKVEAQLIKSAQALKTEQASNATLQSAIARQNAAVNDLVKTSAAQQRAATKAENQANDRAKVAESTSARLAASARASAENDAGKASCQPSKALQGAWK